MSYKKRSYDHGKVFNTGVRKDSDFQSLIHTDSDAYSCGILKSTIFRDLALESLHVYVALSFLQNLEASFPVTKNGAHLFHKTMVTI